MVNFENKYNKSFVKSHALFEICRLESLSQVVCVYRRNKIYQISFEILFYAKVENKIFF